MSKPPPLIVWLIASGVFILLELLIYRHSNREARLNRIISQEITRAENYRQEKKGSCKVVVAIGSSLTGNALWAGSDFAGNSMEKWGKDIYMMALSGAADPGEMLIRDLNLTDRVLTLKPDLFMVQMELAAVKFEPLKTSSFPDYTPFLMELGSSNLDFFKIFFLQQKIAAKFNLPEKDRPLAPQDTMTLSGNLLKREIKTPEEIVYLTDALRRLREAGIPVLIYDVPKPYANERIIYSGLFKMQLDSMLNSLKTGYNADYLPYNGPRMYYRYFSDGGHMNTSGSNLFTDWLNAELVQRLYEE